jgi:TRAP-type C4-dicarboxylate transport system permease large subunit
VPYVFIMLAFMVVMCFVPGIATWLPDMLMGPGR